MAIPSARWSRTGPRLLLAALIGGAMPLSAQQLQLKRNDPASDPFTCPTIESPGVPSDEERRQANELASLAAEALVVGERDRAVALLSRATELDPSSPELAYRRARLGEDMGDRATAVTELCRFLNIGTERDAIADARARLATMTGAGQAAVPALAIEKYREGLKLADEGQLQDAAESFAVAIARGPVWADAYYNSALIWMQLGQRVQAEQDLRRYLALRPDAPDAIAVSRRLGRLEGLGAVKTPEPGGVLMLGMIMPGLGQFYSGRALGGLTMLSLTGSAVGIGLLAKEVEKTCKVTVAAGQTCPSGQQVESTRRPYLAPALAAAALVHVAGAIEAYVRARHRRVETDVPIAEAPRRDGPRLVGLSVSTNGARSDLTLVGLAFD